MGVGERLKLTVVLTHPVQYYAAWFRHIASHCPEIALTVLYVVEPMPQQQGVGFEQPIAWDTPMTDGYRCRIVRQARDTDCVHSDRFWGVDAPQVGSAIRGTHPDVVLVCGWYSIALVRALLFCSRRGIPVLYRGDTHLGNRPAGWRRPAWGLKTWLLLRLCRGYLSVGKRTREYLRHFGLPDSEIFDVPHCVDNDFFARSAAPYQAGSTREGARLSLGLLPDEFVVLFVGKLEQKKRPLDAVRAVAALGPGCRLLMVGSGRLNGDARKEAHRLKAKVAWAGFLNQSELGRAYAAADCLVLPSDWGDTWGLVVNEALACGVPCVVSDQVGCAPDLVLSGETGEIFPFGDVPSLAGTLERIRGRLKGGHDFAPTCRRQVDAYSFAAATRGLLKACRFAAGRAAFDG